MFGVCYAFLMSFSPYLGYRLVWGASGVFPKDWYKTCLCNFSPWKAQESPRTNCLIKSKQARAYGKTPHTHPFWAVLNLFAYPTPRSCIVGLTPCKTIVLSNKRIPQAVCGPEPPSDPLLKPTLLRGRGWRLWGEGQKCCLQKRSTRILQQK